MTETELPGKKPTGCAVVGWTGLIELIGLIVIPGLRILCVLRACDPPSANDDQTNARPVFRLRGARLADR